MGLFNKKKIFIEMDEHGNIINIDDGAIVKAKPKPSPNFWKDWTGVVGGGSEEAKYKRTTKQADAAPKSGGIPSGKQKTSSEAFTEQVEQNACSDHQGRVGWG